MLRRRGGVATRAQLVQTCGRAQVDAALAQGRLVVVARGRYALSTVDADLRVAHALGGVLSWSSAALQHGWEVLRPPELPHVTVRRGRNLRVTDARVHHSTLDVDDVTGPVTSAERTVVDCLRSLPFDEALAVADSALRSGRSQRWLVSLTAGLDGPGSGQARRVAGMADARADNPFESGLRALALGAGLRVEPQVNLSGPDGFLGRPDLVDRERGLVLEADSFAWHGSRRGLVRDARRYNAFVLAGWRVLRFSWEDVVLEPHRVEAVMRAVVQGSTHVTGTA